MIKEENGNITIDVTEVQLIKSLAVLQDLIKYLENLKNKEELMEAVKTAHDASMAFYMEHFQGEEVSEDDT